MIKMTSYNGYILRKRNERYMVYLPNFSGPKATLEIVGQARTRKVAKSIVDSNIKARFNDIWIAKLNAE